MNNVKWQHWLSNSNEQPRPERSMMVLQGRMEDTKIQIGRIVKIPFTSTGGYARHSVKFAISGIRSSGELAVGIDGNHLQWSIRNGTGMDRGEYEVWEGVGLEAGSHVLTFHVQEEGDDRNARLYMYEVIEYGDETKCAWYDFYDLVLTMVNARFNTTFGNVGMYPT